MKNKKQQKRLEDKIKNGGKIKLQKIVGGKVIEEFTIDNLKDLEKFRERVRKEEMEEKQKKRYDPLNKNHLDKYNQAKRQANNKKSKIPNF